MPGALAAALNEGDFEKHLSPTAALDRWVRVRLGRLGLVPLAEGREACPGIITCRLAKPLCSRSIGDRLKEAGFLISYESRYLLERNWIQICLMSDISKPRLRGFIDHLGQLLRN
jgi:aspartate aminotransferase-like enzyme